MNEVQYDRMQEDVAIGSLAIDIIKAIGEEWGCSTPKELARYIYKSIGCGPSIGYRLWEGTDLWNGNPEIEYITFEQVRGIWVSSIVEGSDAEVPPQLFDSVKYAQNEELTIEECVTKFDELLEEIDAEACALWDEANQEEE